MYLYENAHMCHSTVNIHNEKILKEFKKNNLKKRERENPNHCGESPYVSQLPHSAINVHGVTFHIAVFIYIGSNRPF